MHSVPLPVPSLCSSHHLAPHRLPVPLTHALSSIRLPPLTHWPRTLPPLHGRVDHVWFSEDEDDDDKTPKTTKQDETQTQTAFWLAKDKKRTAKAKAAAATAAAAAAPPPPPLSLALKNACQMEMSRLRASFERVARGEEEEEGEGGEVPLSPFPPRTGAGCEGENRLTGLAVTLHGGASLAWEQR